ncbi:hypothetical protein [Deinococcus sp.]|uniref:hypothetical protein n=1 Tax=Deinococcus sp. TaxID=47478 RepID=UPI003C7EA492
MTPPVRGPGGSAALEETAARPPAFWPGLLLNLVLPGSGFTFLNRPWLHLAALALTLLDWLAAWLLILYVGYSGLAPDTRFPRFVETGLILLGIVMFLASYVLLTVGYVRVYRRLGSPYRVWLKRLLILLHLGGLLLLVLPPLLGNPLVF